MFYKTGEPLITLHRKANRNGKFYYFGTLESVSWYLFSSGQFWFGMSEKSRNGDLMIKSNFNNKLVKFGIWAKQSDGTIVIFCDVKGGKYGLVGEYNKKSISFFWADTESKLLKLSIKDNYPSDFNSPNSIN
jgi:hypothetical protein